MKERLIKVSCYEFDDFTDKTNTQNYILDKILKIYIEVECFSDTRIYDAQRKSEELRTPWFFQSYVFDYCKDSIIDLAKEYYYLEDGKIIGLIEDIDEGILI